MRKKLVYFFLLGLLSQDGRAGFFDEDSPPDATLSSTGPVEQDARQLEQKEAFEKLLADVEKRYGETAALLKSLHRQIEQKRRSLDKIRRDIQAYQQQIDKESKELATQVRSAYAMGQQEKLKLILNQQDPALSSRMMIYYNYLNMARLTKLASIQESVKRLDELDKQQQAETELLENNLEQKQAEQTALNNFRKQRHELLKQAATEFSSNDPQLNQLQISENKLKTLVASLPNEVDDSQKQQSSKLADDRSRLNEDSPKVNGDFSTLKGKLPWPVRGKLASNLGNSQTEEIRDGVLIDAKEGSEIHAVTQGKVAYADWLRGYGLLIIIEHDNRYMTLYGFNQSLYKRVGESVEAGEVIASVGQSDGRSQPGLYFGIRKQGEPIDPLEWCRK
ncbi:MAG: murein hydrolase activator EnvC family protein [Methylococcaceae bacterium]